MSRRAWELLLLLSVLAGALVVATSAISGGRSSEPRRISGERVTAADPRRPLEAPGPAASRGATADVGDYVADEQKPVPSSAPSRANTGRLVCSAADPDACLAGGTIADDPLLERVSWKQAAAWWPYRLLRSDLPQLGLDQEAVYAGTDRLGGTSNNPRKTRGSVNVYYWRGESSPERHGFFPFIDAGGIQLRFAYYPPGSTVAWQEALQEHETVIVRDRRARMTVLRKEANSNVDWRAIRWEDVLPDGGTLQWTFSAHPDLYTTREVVEFIDELHEYPG